MVLRLFTDRSAITRLGTESEDAVNLHVGFICFVPKTGTRSVTIDRSVTIHQGKIAPHFNEVQELCKEESSSAGILLVSCERQP